MSFLLSTLCAVAFAAFWVASWAQRRKESLRLAAQLTSEFADAAAELVDDPAVPGDVKEFVYRIAPRVDDIACARMLLKRLQSNEPKQEMPFAMAALGQEQQRRVAQTILLFTLAMSFWDGRRGRKLRELVMKKDADKRVAPQVARALDSDEFQHDGALQAA